MIDEMAIKLQNDSLNYSNEIKSLKQVNEEKFKEYEEKINTLNVSWHDSRDNRLNSIIIIFDLISRKP